jgi:hypothetical protein
MPDLPPRKSKTPAQEAFETLAFLWGGVAIAAFFGWQYNLPIVHPLVQQINRALSPHTLPLLEKPLATSTRPSVFCSTSRRSPVFFLCSR